MPGIDAGELEKEALTGRPGMVILPARENPGNPYDSLIKGPVQPCDLDQSPVGVLVRCASPRFLCRAAVDCKPAASGPAPWRKGPRCRPTARCGARRVPSAHCHKKATAPALARRGAGAANPCDNARGFAWIRQPSISARRTAVFSCPEKRRPHCGGSRRNAPRPARLPPFPAAQASRCQGTH